MRCPYLVAKRYVIVNHCSMTHIKTVAHVVPQTWLAHTSAPGVPSFGACGLRRLAKMALCCDATLVTALGASSLSPNNVLALAGPDGPNRLPLR